MVEGKPKEGEPEASEKEAAIQIQQQAERAQVREKVTLNIWDVPAPLGRRFVDEAKRRFGGKSWLYLQHLMENELTSEMLRNKLELIHVESKASYDILQSLGGPADAGSQEPASDEITPIKTFGGGKIPRTTKGDD